MTLLTIYGYEEFQSSPLRCYQAQASRGLLELLKGDQSSYLVTDMMSQGELLFLCPTKQDILQQGIVPLTSPLWMRMRTSKTRPNQNEGLISMRLVCS